VRLFVGLLGRPEESLRLLGLRLLLSFVPLLPAEPIIPQQAGAQVLSLQRHTPTHRATPCNHSSDNTTHKLVAILVATKGDTLRRQQHMSYASADRGAVCRHHKHWHSLCSMHV